MVRKWKNCRIAKSAKTVKNAENANSDEKRHWCQKCQNRQ